MINVVKNGLSPKHIINNLMWHRNKSSQYDFREIMIILTQKIYLAKADSSKVQINVNHFPDLSAS